METTLAHAGTCRDEKTGAISMPVYQTATFRHPSLGQSTGYDYSRSGNPTRAALEEVMAEVEGGAKGLAFSSGMAAIDCLFRIFRPGDAVAVTEDPYGGTFRLADKVFRPMGIDVWFVDTSRNDEVARVLERGVKAVFVETVTNPMLRIADLPAICKMAAEKVPLPSSTIHSSRPVLRSPSNWALMRSSTALRNILPVITMCWQASS